MQLFQSIKRISLVVFLLFVAIFSLNAQNNNHMYDKALADSLGADQYGMKMYVLVILKTGPANLNKQQTDSLFGAHLKNVQRLAKLGKLVVAGPMQTNEKQYQGIFILNAKTTEEAKALLQTDPAVHAGLLDPELYGWYGSAALPMYLPYSEKVQKTTF